MRYTSYLALAMALAAPALARPDGVGGHHGDHGAGHHVEHAGSASAYDAPSTGYEQPASSYDVPSTGYEQPTYEQSYEQPSYEQPSYEQAAYEPSYDEPSSGYGTEVAEPFEPSMLIVPILILAGLMLLFPSVRCLAVVPGGALPAGCKRRRRREAGDSPANLVERVQDIYLAVLESEECMERVACEVGGIAADAGLNKGMTKMAESYMPKKYQKMMKNFNSAKDCHKIKCGAF